MDSFSKTILAVSLVLASLGQVQSAQAVAAEDAATWEALPALVEGIGEPSSIDLDPATGHVWILDRSANEVVVVDHSRTVQLRFGTSGTGEGEFDRPSGIDVADGEVFVSDGGNHRVQVFATDGSFIRQWGGLGAGDGQLDTPTGVAVLSGEAFVVDSGNNRIQVLDPQSGSFVRQIGAAGNGDGELTAPTDIAIDGNSVHVVDAGNGRVSVFDTGGAWERHVAQGQPVAIDTDRNGALWVADGGANTVTAYDAAGAPTETIALPQGAGVDPTSIVVDRSPGSFWIGDSSQHVSPFTRHRCGRAITHVGTAFNDVISAGAEEASVWAGGGDDTLIGGPANDHLCGGPGRDTITGGAGDDDISGGAGDDSVDAGAGDDFVGGGDGNDHLIGGPGRDEMVGSDGADLLEGGDDADRLKGGEPFDRDIDILRGEGGNDFITRGEVAEGGDGHDAIFGTSFNDVLHGGAGDDNIFPGGGDDLAFGERGRDFINASSGDDVLSGGFGYDTINGGFGNDIIKGGPGNDTLVGGGDIDRCLGGMRYDVSRFCEFGQSLERFATIDDWYKVRDLVPRSDVAAMALQPANGRLLVAHGGEIDAYRHDGKLVKTFSAGSNSTTIGGMVVGGGRFTTRIYVSDSSGDQIVVLNARGEKVASWGTTGAAESQLDNPTGLDLTGNDLFVADTNNDRISAFDSRSGSHTRSFGTQGSGPGELDAPTGLAIRGDMVFVMDSGNDRIAVFDVEGVWLRNIDTGPIVALDTDRSGRLFVTTGAGPIRIYLPTGELRGELPQDEIGDGRPGMILVERLGETLWIHDTLGDVVQAYSLLKCNTYRLTHVGTSYQDRIRTGPGDDIVLTGAKDDVAVLGDGQDIVCAGGGRDRIYGGKGKDSLRGGPDQDWLYGGRDNDALRAGSLARDDRSPTTRDVLFGGQGADSLWAGAIGGDLAGGAGPDRLFGAPRSHLPTIANYGNARGPVTVDLAGGFSRGAAGRDTLFVRGDIVGSEFDDRLFGDDNSNIIFAGAGDDVIDGRGGADRIDAWFGDDTMIGGAGRDRCDGGPGTDTAAECESVAGVP